MEHQLVFNEETHRYFWGGREVPGVTRILAPLSDFSGIPPNVLAAKAELGRQVHSAAEMLDDGELDWSSLSERVLPYVKAYQAFLDMAQPVVLASEQRVFNPELMYAGTLDRIYEINGEEWLVDLKTPFIVPASAGPQTAAYAAATGKAPRRGVLQLKPDETYRLVECVGPTDWQVFQSCLVIHRFKENHRA